MGTLHLSLGRIERPVEYGRGEHGDGYWARCTGYLASRRGLYAGDVSGEEKIEDIEVVLFSPYRDAPYCTEVAEYHPAGSGQKASLFLRLNVDLPFLMALNDLPEGDHAQVLVDIQQLAPRDGGSQEQSLGIALLKQQPNSQYGMKATVTSVTARFVRAERSDEAKPDPMMALHGQIQGLEQRLDKMHSTSTLIAWMLGALVVGGLMFKVF